MTRYTRDEKKLRPSQQNLFSEAVPEDFNCPITCEVMDDPVVAADGHSYERIAIEQWIAQRGGRAISP